MVHLNKDLHLLIGTLLLLSLGATASCADSDTAIEDARPNIVLIVADDHGLDAIGAYGNESISTPNIDRLAAEGVRFTQGFATVSSCSPSRSVLLTGKHNHANGMYGLQHQEHHFSSLDGTKSLPVLLSDGGYRTALAGKLHLAPAEVYRFDEKLSVGAANDMASIARSPVELAELAKEFIANTQAPFFLYYAADDPHRAFPFDTSPEPNNFGNRASGYPGITPVTYDVDDVTVPSFLPDTLATRKELAEYYQSVSRLDQGVGRLVEILNESGKSDNTVVIYLSDNGIAFPGAKTTLYDPGIHLPLIIKDPTQSAKGVVNEGLVSWADISPTILDYAGLSADASDMHGRSFRPGIGERSPDGRNEVYGSHSFHEIHMYYPMRMIRTKQHKLIWNVASGLKFPVALDLYQSLTWQAFVASGETTYGRRPTANFSHRPQFELYDLVNDPDEVTNLAYDEAHQALLQEMIAKLKTFQKETDDPWQTKWEWE